VVLYQPEIPQNTGNIGRTCLAIGAKLWLIRPLGFRIDEHHLRRAGLDYWEHLDWQAVPDWESYVQTLDMQHTWLFSKAATKNYTDVAYDLGDTLVFGSESQGLPPSLMEKHPDRVVGIPIREPVRSLNLSSAVAIAGYEALRQWRELDRSP
jgi:tRNA (cytidine/uridine-2'-O-)-methyltransferase